MIRKSINWNAVAAIGQVISGAAVAVTLYYLTVQVRSAEIAASDANRLARADGVTSFWLSAAHSPEFRQNTMSFPGRSATVRELARRLEISEEQASQIESVAHYWFWLHWGQWSTTMEERDLAELRGMVQTYYTLPQVRAIWEVQRGWMAADFEAFVDEAIAEVDEGRGPAFRGHSSVGELASKLDELGIGVPLGAQASPGGEAQGD